MSPRSRCRRQAANRARILGAAAALAFIVAPVDASADDIPLVATGLDFVPESEIRDSPGMGEFQSIRWGILAIVPIVTRERTVITLIPTYRLWQYSAADDGEDIRVHDGGLTIAWRQQLSARWALIVSASVGLASDFDDIAGDHVRVTGGVSAERVFSPNLVLGAGVAASYVFGELLPVPIVVANWQASRNVRVFARVPERAALTYRLAPWLEVGPVVALDGNRFSAVIDDVAVVDRLAISRASVELRAGVRIVRGLWLGAYAGSTIFRRLQAFDSSDVELADFGLERAPVYGVSLELRVARKPRKQAGR